MKRTSAWVGVTALAPKARGRIVENRSIGRMASLMHIEATPATISVLGALRGRARDCPADRVRSPGGVNSR